MNLIIFATVIVASSAALLPERNYIPQGQGSQGSQGQYFESSQSSHRAGGGGSGSTGNTRQQQDIEKNAAVVKQDQEISDDGSYHFGYETSNGIRTEEAGNSAQAQGGFAYKGDDGHTYTITYSAGEEGFRPQGEHLPVAPPTPEAILEALQQNAKDEAAGIFDDGQYHPDAHGSQSGHGSGQSVSSSHKGSFNQKTGYSY